ncbi:MAG TPA: hypothetical protein ENO28_06805 [Bacteroidetes bacterium]|nr:hypothetical protein [Bacteroidota bacterium]
MALAENSQLAIGAKAFLLAYYPLAEANGNDTSRISFIAVPFQGTVKKIILIGFSQKTFV